MRLENKVYTIRMYVMCLTGSLWFIGAVFEKSYLGSVSAMKLNSLYAAVLYDGKVQLHAVRMCVQSIVV